MRKLLELSPRPANMLVRRMRSGSTLMAASTSATTTAVITSGGSSFPHKGPSRRDCRSNSKSPRLPRASNKPIQPPRL